MGRADKREMNFPTGQAGLINKDEVFKPAEKKNNDVSDLGDNK